MEDDVLKLKEVVSVTFDTTPCLLLLVLAFYQIFGELFGSLLNNPYLCTRNVIAVKFTDVKIYEEFL